MIEHIAFIMDGNGRFAKAIGKSRSYGHKIGFENMISIIKSLDKSKIKYASFYAFSTENWNRPVKEVDFLMTIPKIIFNNDLEYFKEANVKVNFFGLKTRISSTTRSFVEKIEHALKDNDGLTVNVMFDYGFETELVDAVNKIINSDVKSVDITAIKNNLYTANIPNIDLMIRTGGEQRLSNFMLLQLAYAELFFTNTFWPEFKANELYEIIEQFEKRDRRFGGIKDENKI